MNVNSNVYILDQLTNNVAEFNRNDAATILQSRNPRFRVYDPNKEGYCALTPVNVFIDAASRQNTVGANMSNMSNMHFPNMHHHNHMNTYGSTMHTMPSDIMGITNSVSRHDGLHNSGVGVGYRSRRRTRNVELTSGYDANDYVVQNMDSEQDKDKRNYVPLVPYGVEVIKVPIGMGQYGYNFKGNSMLKDTTGNILYDLDESISGDDGMMLITALPGTIHVSPAALVCEAAATHEKVQAVTITVFNTIPYLVPSKLEQSLQEQLVKGTNGINEVHTRFCSLKEQYKEDKIYLKFFGDFDKMMTKRINEVTLHALPKKVRVASFEKDYPELNEYYNGIEESVRKHFYMYMSTLHRCLVNDANILTEYEDIEKESFNLNNIDKFSNGRVIEYYYETLNVIYVNTNDQPYLGNDIKYDTKYEVNKNTFPLLHDIIMRASVKNHKKSRAIMVIDDNDFDVITTSDGRFIIEKI